MLNAGVGALPSKFLLLFAGPPIYTTPNMLDSGGGGPYRQHQHNQPVSNGPLVLSPEAVILRLGVLRFSI